MSPMQSGVATNLAEELRVSIERESKHLSHVTEMQSLERSAAADSWSRREELGHLIDSAVNNHWRFVRAALQGELAGPGYDQNGWVRLHGYHECPWAELISLWQQHNAALVQVIRRIPEG